MSQGTGEARRFTDLSGTGTGTGKSKVRSGRRLTLAKKTLEIVVGYC
jgi:hypothetical protein